MTKTVYRLGLGDYWRIGESESWFSDMAANGLHLYKRGLIFTHFTKGLPVKTRYRVELVGTGDRLSSEQIQMYAEHGWEYVTSYGMFHVFRSPDELGAPELHTDPAEQSFTLKSLSEQFTRSATFVVIAVALMFAMLICAWVFDYFSTLSIVEGSTITLWVVVILELYVAYSSLQAAISMRALQKSLSEGRPINHHANWRSHRNMSILVSILCSFIGISMIVLPFGQTALSRTSNLPELSSTLPIVLLDEVEKNPDMERKSQLNSDNIDRANSYRYNWTLLAPIQYESREEGIVSTEMWADGSGIYKPSITSRIYHLRFGFMADNLVNDLIKRYSIWYRGEGFLQKDHPNFDLLLTHEDKEYKEVCAFKGKSVMYIRYHGYSSMDNLVEQVAEKLIFLEVN